MDGSQVTNRETTIGYGLTEASSLDKTPAGTAEVPDGTPDGPRAGAPAEAVVGRARERRLIDALLIAMTDQGAALILRGEPGIGKTTLLDYAAAAAPGRVLRAAGVQSEAVLPYVTLADLLLPIRHLLGGLPRVQAEALKTCLALSNRPETNPYAACVGTLNLLAAAGDVEPTLVVVDDLHWVDPSSLQVLLFTARRLSAERVALVASVRDDLGDLGDLDPVAGVSAVSLSGLSAAESAHLLHQRGYPVAPTVCAELTRVCGGNPLALLQTATTLHPSQLRGERPWDKTPALDHRLELAWSARLRQLPAETLDALAVVAASRSGLLADLQGALPALGLSLGVLGPAERAGLLTLAGQRYDLTHPVLRPLVLSRTAVATRLAVYQALAHATTGTLRAWYLAAAATGPDDNAATALVEAARDARDRSAFAAAARAWYRAAELTGDPTGRAGRLHAAAADALLGGATTDAALWCDQALAAPVTPDARADLELLRGRIHTWTGEAGEAQRRMVRAADLVRSHDPARAALLLAEASILVTITGDVPAAQHMAEDSLHLAASDPAATWVCSTACALALALAGRVAEVRSRLHVAAEHAAHTSLISGLPIHAVTAWCLIHSDDHDAARRLLTDIIDTARRAGTPFALPLILVIRCELDTWAGRWASAHADAVEAQRWAEELRQPTSIALGLVHQARIDAARGERARCEDLIAESRARIGPYGVGALETYHTSALGLAALTHGQFQGGVVDSPRDGLGVQDERVREIACRRLVHRQTRARRSRPPHSYPGHGGRQGQLKPHGTGGAQQWDRSRSVDHHDGYARAFQYPRHSRERPGRRRVLVDRQARGVEHEQRTGDPRVAYQQRLQVVRESRIGRHRPEIDVDARPAGQSPQGGQSRPDGYPGGHPEQQYRRACRPRRRPDRRDPAQPPAHSGGDRDVVDAVRPR